MTLRTQDEKIAHFDEHLYYYEQVNQVVDPFLERFFKILKTYFFIHLAFLIIGAVELLLFLYFLSNLINLSALSLSIASIFLTLFVYLTLKIYWSAKKKMQIHTLKEYYLSSCKQLLNYKEGIIDCHLAVANACCKLASKLEGKELSIYTIPRFLSFFNPILGKLGVYLHWKDFFEMKEQLLSASIEEQLKLVKCDPISLEAHANLANAYVMLSGLYDFPAKGTEGEEGKTTAYPEEFLKETHRKFRETAEKAMEEFKILSDFAPADPWVHAQLAYSYHDLKMPKEEIQEYETILKLCPEDKETLYRLGILYFQNGFNAKGLKVYEELKRSHYKKADALIKYYGAYEPLKGE